MKVNNVELVISAVRPDQYPNDRLPEFALSGRSNVGKSSFINKMIDRKSMARTSSTPGKTQTLNFYKIEEALYFVDVPGYGFAKVSKREREIWGAMIERYLTERAPLKAVLLIVDLRHPPTADDVMMYNYLKHFELPCVIIATKVDKIPRGKIAKHVKRIKDDLSLYAEDQIIVFSSENGTGKDEAWNTIEHGFMK